MKSAASGLIFMIFFVGMLTAAQNIQCVKTESSENDLGTQLIGGSQPSFEVSSRWILGNAIDWDGFAYVDDDSVELVIGLDDRQPNSYSKLVDLIVNNRGKIANTMLMGGKIWAVVADMPHGVVPSFTSDVEAAALSRYIEPNIMFKVDFFPDDPAWSSQWGPRVIEADYAWNTTMGNPSVLVAVVDSGIDWDHPDLMANYVPLGFDWVNNDTDPMDDRGHGTHCAGIIGAVINNGIGIAGLAQVGIMAEKGIGSGGIGWSSNLANGIVHAVDQGADIISCSWGGFFHSTVIFEAVKYAVDADVLVIAAAGNEATECAIYPSRYEEVVAVTATDSSDDLASFTNFGEWVEVAAPGVEIYSTIWDNSYKNSSGTSMSTPHVAGVAALIWSQFPDMTRDEVRAQLRSTAEDLGAAGFDKYYGHGRVNAKRAVEQPPPDHDLTLLYWKAPSLLKPLTTLTINGSLLNFGANNESDIAVQLLANGSTVESLLVSNLASGESTPISFAWNPAVEGKYNITLHVEPVTGETLTENNILSKFVLVRSSQIVMIPNDFATIQMGINAVDSGYTLKVEPGVYFEHIIIPDKSIALVGESRQTTIIDGYGNNPVVWVLSASNAKISGFTVQNGAFGMLLSGALYCNIMENMIRDNMIGMVLDGCFGNVISSNTNITDNIWGIFFHSSVDNILFHNNFVDNYEQVDRESAESNNVWDDGYPSGGNYWSDYKGEDANGDGIGDTRYFVPPEDEDRYPLVNPWGKGMPTANFTWTPLIPNVNERVAFDASPSKPIGGEIVDCEWDFGDGSYNSGKTATHIYARPGTFTVTLNVTDSEGLWNVSQKQIPVLSAVGGYSFSLDAYTSEKPLTFYMVVVAILTVSLAMVKRIKHRKKRIF